MNDIFYREKSLFFCELAVPFTIQICPCILNWISLSFPAERCLSSNCLFLFYLSSAIFAFQSDNKSMFNGTSMTTEKPKSHHESEKTVKAYLMQVSPFQPGFVYTLDNWQFKKC